MDLRDIFVVASDAVDSNDKRAEEILAEAGDAAPWFDLIARPIDGTPKLLGAGRGYDQIASELDAVVASLPAEWPAPPTMRLRVLGRAGSGGGRGSGLTTQLGTIDAPLPGETIAIVVGGGSDSGDPTT